jgi:putative transposase
MRNKNMSKKRKTYSADFMSKLVLEVIKNEKTINEIASQYEVLPKSLRTWHKQFLENNGISLGD